MGCVGKWVGSKVGLRDGILLGIRDGITLGGAATIGTAVMPWREAGYVTTNPPPLFNP